MYLKSIEVQGFKSFANKIVFQFHNGITGIVGPNGSGKSNVADAVRWVLGEQRIKQLRGASMQDVIFAGTELRKPVSSAYVAITLDNSDHSLAIDFEEVTVGRRIYRSGESEYSINGSPCRLKDVNELFYDTGIGKEGYSIIGQGQIDKILNGKPEERRELFDEAAGIVKFKRRKDQAQKKLEDEKQNLTRVNDILAEREKQIGPLEKQAEKAKVYLKKKEELKTLDVNVFLLENAKVRGQLEEANEKYKIASEELASVNTKYEAIREEYDQVQATLESLEAEIEEARNALSNTNVIRGRLEGEINVLKEQINSATGNGKHLLERKDSVLEEIRLKEVEKAGILEKKSQIDQKLKDASDVRDAAVKALQEVQDEITAYNEKIDINKNQIIEILNNRATIKTKLGRIDSTAEQINIRKAELNAKLLRAKSDEAAQVEAIKQLEDIFAKVSEEITELSGRQKTLEERNSAIREELSKSDSTLREKQLLLQQVKTKLESITNLTERYEGYGNSIKKVMERKEKEPGIIGVVADIIKVEKKYETAIEIALGGNIQNIVTKDEQTAKNTINYLKQNKFGRATFLPLTSITRPQEFKATDVLKENGVIGLADELVQIEDEYRNVAKAMLGRIVVVDQVDNALKIAKKFDQTVRMVTLEGELIVPGGAISGGAFKNNSNLLGRRREIEELEAQVKKLTDEVENFDTHIDEIREERNQIRTELQSVNSELQKKFIEQNTARMNVAAAKAKKDENGQNYDDMKAEEQEISAKNKELKAEKEAILLELEESEKAEVTINEEITKQQAVLDQKRELESEKSKAVSATDVEVEKMLQRQGFEQTNVDRIDGELARFLGEKQEIEENLIKNDADIEEKKKAIEEIENTIKASHSAQTDTETKLKDDLAKREELNTRQKNFFHEREELSEKITGLDKEVYRLNAQKERLEESMESSINYMWDEYEITLSVANGMRNEELTDLPKMKKEISSLKDQIKKLGDVNVNAIEEYKELMESYTFLKTQHDDLIEAEKTLEGIIRELDVAMRKQFTESFAQISREFDKVFKELFGGGKGTLELMEEEDILEAGISINAQPPGKKLQNMMQLSGGEKAMTAIALLFAIQNLKPSPFCLLDEIEAALDEANVSRYANYLHKLTKHTQFIIITHRRGTMEQADRLYGITMQEKGVSTLVSVDLIEKDLDA